MEDHAAEHGDRVAVGAGHPCGLDDDPSALVLRKRNKPRKWSGWHCRLGTIDPGAECAADAGYVGRGGVLDEQLAALPAGAAAVLAAVAVQPLRARHPCIIGHTYDNAAGRCLACPSLRGAPFG
jgi:hypothetical protein